MEEKKRGKRRMYRMEERKVKGKKEWKVGLMVD